MKRLARALGINRAWAGGILEFLWHWAGKFSPQGDIGKHEDIDIAEGCFWDRSPQELIEALVETGWIHRSKEHRLIIHDWHDHADEAVIKRLSRSKLQFLTRLDGVSTESRHSLDGVAQPEAQAQAKALAKAEAVETFETAMDRVDVQLRGQVPAEFSKMVFETWDQRGGKDGAGILVRFEKLLRKRWNAEGDQWRNGCHSAQKSVKKEPPRNMI